MAQNPDFSLDTKTSQGVAGPWEKAIRVHQVELVDAAPIEFSGATQGPFREPAYPWARFPGRFFVDTGFNKETGLRYTRTYDPTAEVSAILTAATTVDTVDDLALLDFVNRWGILGCAEPSFADQWIDSVEMTRGTISELQRLARWLSAMQEGSWLSPAIPPFEELRGSVRASADLAPRDHRKVIWMAFANALNRNLWDAPLHIVLRIQNGSPSPALIPRCLADVLWIELWRRATNVRTKLRACSGCGGLFSVSITDRKRRYCSPTCKNRMQFRRWYGKRANRRKLSEKRRKVRKKD